MLYITQSERNIHVKCQIQKPIRLILNMYETYKIYVRLNKYRHAPQFVTHVQFNP